MTVRFGYWFFRAARLVRAGAAMMPEWAARREARDVLAGAKGGQKREQDGCHGGYAMRRHDEGGRVPGWRRVIPERNRCRAGGNGLSG
jgi:hypothetical protein